MAVSEDLPYNQTYYEAEMLREYTARVDNLTDPQWEVIKDFRLPGMKCMMDYWDAPKPDGVFCDAHWDTLMCWPSTPGNTTVFRSCPDSLSKEGLDSGPVAHRTCLANGTWEHGDWTNYTICVINMINGYQTPTIDPHQIHQAIVVSIIYFSGSIISAILLIITLFIFSYFKVPLAHGFERMNILRRRPNVNRKGSGYLKPRTGHIRTLQCNRISIHKNLVLSFIVRCIVLVILLEPLVTNREKSYRNIPWLCRGFTVLQQYSLIANIFWMFVEGLFLHNRVAVSVFNSDAPFKVFYFVGWGLPAIIVVVWALCLHFNHEHPCWNDHTFLPYNWIILVPIIVALFVNLVFLVNIIRILITKLRAHNTVETDQVRKAVKALGVLYPLLGLTNVSFLIAPSGAASIFVYRVTNAVLHSSQGIFVSVIYCFMNSEVRTAIRKKWIRYRSLRMHSSRRGSSGLRTNSVYLSEVISNGPPSSTTTKDCYWKQCLPFSSSSSSSPTPTAPSTAQPSAAKTIRLVDLRPVKTKRRPVL